MNVHALGVLAAPPPTARSAPSAPSAPSAAPAGDAVRLGEHSPVPGFLAPAPAVPAPELSQPCAEAPAPSHLDLVTQARHVAALVLMALSPMPAAAAAIQESEAPAPSIQKEIPTPGYLGGAPALLVALEESGHPSGRLEAAGAQPSAPTSGNPFAELARSKPGALVNFMGFPMRADAAKAFYELREAVYSRFPGRRVRVTSTMGGRHKDPGHKQGRSIDFVVEPLTKRESRVVEQLSRKAGFRPFNEYLHGSRYKTGDHMHITLVRGGHR